jgi:ATP-binding cassette subfamily E protein 1
MKPLRVEELFDNEVGTLSGGELQRVALVLALGLPADIYLIDEPSAYLDSEQRLIAAKVIKRFILHAKKTAFVVEHDFIMATYLADRVVVYDGQPSIRAIARAPQSLLTGMNHFLKSLEITFRRDPSNNRPRINKRDSVKDREQKASGDYFFLEEPEQKQFTGKPGEAKPAEGGKAEGAAPAAAASSSASEEKGKGKGKGKRRGGDDE